MVDATWSNGLTLMIAGMVVVYLLLVVMILSMKAMSAMMGPLSKILPEPVKAEPKKAKAKSSNDEEIVAAIVAARIMKK